MFFDTVATSGLQYCRGGNNKKRGKKAEVPQIGQSNTYSQIQKAHQEKRGSTQRPSWCLSSLLSFNSLFFCASLHVHSGVFRFSQSVVVLKKKKKSHLNPESLRREEGHWLSSRAQTCCGQPVRPFTFFSAPNDSCGPSVCDTKNTKLSSSAQIHKPQPQFSESFLPHLTVKSYENIYIYIFFRVW